MSEWVPADRPRPVRILALPSPPQSAASLRAQLAPLINQLPSWWEFHFLEGPFCVGGLSLAADETHEEQKAGRDLRRAILLCSRLEACEGEVRAGKVRKEMQTPVSSRGSYSVTPPPPSPQDGAGADTDEDIKRIEKELSSSSDTATRQVWEAHRRGGIEEAEGLLVQNGFAHLAPERDWYVGDTASTRVPGHKDPARNVGLQLSLEKVGDYIRERGPFHVGIGGVTGESASGYALLGLVSALFSSASAARSAGGARPSESETASAYAYAYPLLFPLLPLSGPAPRMGGWEVMPSVGLPSGRRHAVSQDGFQVLLGLGGGRNTRRCNMSGASQTMWSEARRWWTAADAEAARGQAGSSRRPHSLALLPPVPAGKAPDAAVEEEDEDMCISPTVTASSTSNAVTPGTTAFLAQYLRATCRHLEAVPGLVIEAPKVAAATLQHAKAGTHFVDVEAEVVGNTGRTLSSVSGTTTTERIAVPEGVEVRWHRRLRDEVISGPKANL